MTPVGASVRQVFTSIYRTSVTAVSVNDSCEDGACKGLISGLVYSSQAQSSKPAPRAVTSQSEVRISSSDTTTTHKITEQRLDIDTHRGLQMSSITPRHALAKHVL